LYARLLAEDRAGIGLSLTAAADPRQELGSAGVQHFSNHADLLRAPVDVILIATPPDQHYLIAREALESGKHVLVEKPPAQTAAQAMELGATGRLKQLTVFFAYHARYNRSVSAAKELLASAGIRRFAVTYREDVLNYHDPNGWVFQEGVLKDSGINALSVVTHVLPHSDSLRVTEAEFIRSKDDHSLMQARLNLALHDTLTGSMSLDWQYPGEEKREISVDTGEDELIIDIAADQLRRNGEIVCAGECVGERLACEYREMLKDFAEHLWSGQSSAGTEELRLLEEADRVGRVLPSPENRPTVRNS
jgi:D-galactose 1-dehydrogenase